MKDIPLFTTEFGAASLGLREIPYRKRAYIRLLTTEQPEELLAECISFCRACGAERCDAAGHEILDSFPLVTEVWAMTCPRDQIQDTDACLFPITDDTVAQWLEVYNERMTDVPNAAYLDERDGKALLKKGDCYFVHRDGKLLGIGKAAQDHIDVVASAEAGMGETVLRALCNVLTEDTVRVVVAAANRRAVRLYERMGFLKTQSLLSWYQVL